MYLQVKKHEFIGAQAILRSKGTGKVRQLFEERRRGWCKSLPLEPLGHRPSHEKTDSTGLLLLAPGPRPSPEKTFSTGPSTVSIMDRSLRIPTRKAPPKISNGGISSLSSNMAKISLRDQRKTEVYNLSHSLNVINLSKTNRD